MMDDRLFRDTMGKFSTGVTVITTKHDRQGARDDSKCFHVRIP